MDYDAAYYRRVVRAAGMDPSADGGIHMSEGRLSGDRGKSRFQQVEKARQELGLPEAASIEEIKKQYRLLIKEWHPDVCRSEKSVCEEKTRKIRKAYQVLMEYCFNYRFPFTRDEVEKYVSKEEWWMKRFGNDPVWGR